MSRNPLEIIYVFYFIKNKYKQCDRDLNILHTSTETVCTFLNLHDNFNNLF